jgi:DNA-binding transcriptional LysR family regulator
MSDKSKQINVFLQVVESGSFTKAADALGLSRAMVSLHIKDLEAYLSVSLLNRSTRKVSLSDAGQCFYQDCKNIQQDMAAAIERVQQQEQHIRGTLRISSTQEFGQRFIAPLLPLFAKQYPNLHVDYRFDSSISDLLTDKLDVAIRLGQLPDSSLKSRHLGQYDIVLAATPDYLLNHPIDKPSDLLTSPWIAQSQWQNSHFILEHKDNPAQNFHFIAPKAQYVSNAASLTHTWLNAGLGISICPMWLIAEDLKTGKLQQVLPDYTLPKQNIQAVYLQQRHLPQKIRLFIDFLLQAEKEYSAEFMVLI